MKAVFELLLSEVAALILRFVMMWAGLAVIGLNLLWLGVPSPDYIYWTMAQRAWSVLLWLVGVAGVFAPQLRSATKSRHKQILLDSMVIGFVAWLVCRLVFSSVDRPWIGDFGEVVAELAWISITGGTCLYWTAVARTRSCRPIMPTSAMHPHPRPH